MLSPLTKGMTPMEVTGWLEKFKQWFALAHGDGADDRVKSTELQMMLGLEGSNTLKGLKCGLSWLAILEFQ